MFEIGEEILCVKGLVSNGDIGSVKGCEYIVEGVFKCSCGEEGINIGVKLSLIAMGIRCLKCHATIDTNIWWQLPNRFVRKSSASQADEMLNLITETIELVES